MIFVSYFYHCTLLLSSQFCVISHQYVSFHLIVRNISILDRISKAVQLCICCRCSALVDFNFQLNVQISILNKQFSVFAFQKVFNSDDLSQDINAFVFYSIRLFYFYS